MATYTPEEFEKKILEKQRSLDIVKVVVMPVATAVFDQYRQRLFGKGIKGDGTKTGNYSRKAIYASKDKFRNTGSFRPQGKKEYIKGSKQKTTELYDIRTRKKKKVAITKPYTQRETMYLPNGYKELRAIQGLEIQFVDLQYTGDLFTDFSKLKIVNDSVVAGVSREINKKKIKGLSKRFGNSLFKHTKEEREFFTKEAQKRLIAYFSK